MKVRISGNTIRFRLKEPEVNSFASEGIISDKIEFGIREGEWIQFVLKKSSCKSIQTTFEKNIVVVELPFSISDEWTKTSLVGIDAKVELAGGKSLSVLIEKDFACLDRNDTDNEGTYPNPLANCAPADVTR